MVEIIEDKLFHVRSFFTKTKQDIDTFTVHSQLIKLLNDVRVITKKGEQKEYTHTTIPSKNSEGHIVGGGKYNFSNQENNDKLKDILALCIEHNYYPSTLSLTQKIGTTSCVHIDLDFRYSPTTTIRQYSLSNVSSLINIINNCIKDIYDVPKEKVNAYVFERKSGVVQQTEVTKDGIHLLYPEIITNTKTQYALRDEIIKRASTLFKEEFKSINSVEDIVDKAVIENSNWMLYGARKVNRDPYELTHVFSYQENYKPIQTRKLLDYFDFSTKTKDMELPVNSSYKYLMSESYQDEKGSRKNIKNSNEIKKLTSVNNRRKVNVINSSDMQEIKSLVNILSEERAHNHETWVRVGWCLYNIDKNNLLDSWILFSSKSPKHKIKSSEHGRSPERCMVLWNEMKKQDSGLGIGSLHRWAKEDNAKEYEEIRRSNLGGLITKSMSVTTYDVARVIYEMYKYNFKCISYKENKWYEFQPNKHRWIVVEKAHSLIKLISEDVVKQYLKSIYELNKEATARAAQMTNVMNTNLPTPSASPAPESSGSSSNGIDIFSSKPVKESANTDDTLKMVEDLVAVTYKLRDISFKEKLVKECGTMFGENAKQFLEAMDANPYLIGFDNGVYDLQNDEFRDGRPEDYLTFSTGYDYIDFGNIEEDEEEPEEEVKEIYDFFDQVFPQKAVREYILLLLSSFLGGTTRDEKFHIWTGVGGNGKSKLLELIEFALGDYSCKLSHTVLTRKQSSSSNASPDIEQTKGKRLASIQETEQDDIMNVGRMKELSGGDKIYARGLFKDPIQFKPQFKMILLCNELPKINADDNGTWRRIRVVKFVSKFVDNPKNENEYPIDPLLSEKIYKWKEAFMYILLQKYKKYKKYGLKEPEEVLEVTRDYQRVSDLYNDFINDSITKDEKSHIGLNELYRVFKEWFRNNNNQNTRPPSRTYFKGKMEIKLGQKYEHNKWTGFKIIGEDEDTEEDD